MKVNKTLKTKDIHMDSDVSTALNCLMTSIVALIASNSWLVAVLITTMVQPVLQIMILVIPTLLMLKDTNVTSMLIGNLFT